MKANPKALDKVLKGIGFEHSLEYTIENLIVDMEEEVISFEDLVNVICSMIRNGVDEEGSQDVKPT